MSGLPELDHRSLGAQILQAGLGGQALFYLSPLCRGAAAVAPARGGVPVLFPQFAEQGLLPKHGFARTMPWELICDERGASACVLAYRLDVAPGQHPAWPHAARLVLEAQAMPHALDLRLQVTNTGSSEFSWTGGLHPYFAVQDVRRCRLGGLDGLAVHDRYDPAMRVQAGEWSAGAAGPLERLYDGCPSLVLSTGSHLLALEATGFDQWMVWNPGEVVGHALPDLPSGDWQRFLCVEPVRVARPVTLGPGDVFEGTLRVRLHEAGVPVEGAFGA